MAAGDVLNVIRSSGCTFSARQLRDSSVDRTETYGPLSGKVMLSRWLKWKLCAG